MSNSVIIYYRGLNTHANSTWCGIKPLLESLAEITKSDLLGYDYDQPDVVGSLTRAVKQYGTVYAGGHSHGGYRLYTEADQVGEGAIVTGFFCDIAPAFKPLDWLIKRYTQPMTELPPKGNFKQLARSIKSILNFLQRNDSPLAGIELVEADNIQQYDVTSWGLEHSTMCADQRVWDRIRMQIQRAYIDRLDS